MSMIAWMSKKDARPRADRQRLSHAAGGSAGPEETRAEMKERSRRHQPALKGIGPRRLVLLVGVMPPPP